MAALTYGELRSNAQMIADAEVKARVLKGIEVLNAWDPNWPDRIEPERLKLSSATECVLGQAFAHEEPTDEQAVKYGQSTFGTGEEEASDFCDGYERGIAILDGDLLEEKGPHDHGFVTDDDESYSVLDTAWLMVFGRTDLI